MDREKEIANLEQIFRIANKNANVEPVFEDENGEEHYLPQEAIKVIENILDTLFIPFLAEVVVDAGYRKADEVRKETAREFKQTMKDIFRFVLRNKGNTSIPYFNAEELVFAKFDKEVDREFLQEYGVEVDE